MTFNDLLSSARLRRRRGAAAGRALFRDEAQRLVDNIVETLFSNVGATKKHAAGAGQVGARSTVPREDRR